MHLPPWRALAGEAARHQHGSRDGPIVHDIWLPRPRLLPRLHQGLQGVSAMVVEAVVPNPPYEELSGGVGDTHRRR